MFFKVCFSICTIYLIFELWKIIVHLLHCCSYHFKFIFILSVLYYPLSILVLVSKMSDPVTFMPLCYWKAGAPEILSLFGVMGIKTRPRACSAVHRSKHRGSLADLFLLKALSVTKVSCSKRWVGIEACCSYMKGAKWKINWGAQKRPVFIVANTECVCFMTAAWSYNCLSSEQKLMGRSH